ncbi:Vomp family autotransporter [Bartonella taylorii]|uniref:Vomp family autotransporter n=1 Tax=Bartonella taylorii TaxID=33046 RepID=UPI001ABA4D55|nr:Vomp family autotransporter [Bartonella taylorii]
MKKVYAKLAGGKLNFFRPFYKTSFVKMFSLSSIVALLSSASPVYSKTVAPKEAFLISAKSSSIVFPQSVISVYDDYNVDASDQENYVTALQGGSTLAASAVSDYVNFLINTLSKKSNDNAIVNVLAAYSNSLPKSKSSAEEQYKNFISSPQFSDFSSSIPKQFAQSGDAAMLASRAVNINSRAVNIDNGWYGLTDRDTVWMGRWVQVGGDSSIVLGDQAKYEVPKGSMTTGGIVIGGSAKVTMVSYGVALGYEAVSSEYYAITLGAKAHASKEYSVALGAISQANIDAGISGYDPKIDAAAKEDNHVWKSTLAVVSVGDVAKSKTRQIVGVAAGTQDTDAVNVAQLKALRAAVKSGWKLSVGGAGSTDVGMGNEVDFSAGSNNLTIAKGDKDNKVKFDLGKNLTVDSIKIGNNTLDATGLIITDGPKITITGIDAGNKKITGVEKGTGETDAVNFAQLEEIKEQVASSSFVKQDAQTKHITIGKEADGNKIDIVNNKGENRVISGIANGAISDASTEAMTGQQLHQFGTSIAGYFGGGAKYENGQWSTPKFKVKTVKDDGTESEQSYENVASAFEGVSKSITKIQNNITKEINNVVTKVEGDSLSWSKTDDAFVAKHGAGDAKTNSKVTFLANGDVSKDSQDAINGSQLYSLGDTFAMYFGGGASFSGGTWTAPEFKVKTVKADGTEGEEKVYKNVAAAFEGVSNSITDIHKEIKNEITNVVTKVEGDSLSWSKEDGAFVARHAEKVAGEDPVEPVNSKIKFLAKGDVSKGSTDAINGSQLFETNEKVATYFGGGAKYENGEWTAPKFKVKTVNADGSDVEDKEYKTVAEALAGVGTSITNVKKEINNEITNVKGDSLVKWDEATKLIKIGEEKEGSEINIKNKDGGARTISGVAAGSAETDAVNFSQLQKVEKDVKEQVAASSFVKQDLETKHLTIGKETDGDKIDIANNKNEKRTLTGIKGGALSADSNEAITGSQINKIGEDVAGFFGGGAAFSGGAFTKPSYEIHSIRTNGEVGASGNVHHDVGSALSALNYSLGNVNTRITNTINDFNQKIMDSSQHIEKDALLWNEGAHAFVARHEKKQEEQGRAVRTQENSKITFLLDGNVSEGSTDAVTGNQLYSMGHALSTYLGGDAKYENGKWTAPSFTVKAFNTDGTPVETSYNNVVDAFAGVGNSFTNIHKELTNVVSKVEGDSLSWSKEANAFVARHEHEQSTEETGKAVRAQENSKITFLAKGDVSSTSTDAVNGTQLFETNNKVATYLGGGASFNEGAFTQPTYKLSSVSNDGTVTENSFNDVGAAFTGLDANIKNVNARIKEVSQGVAQDSLSWSKEDDAFIAKHGAEKTASKIKFVAGGDLSKNSTDAVNGTQLFETNDKVATYLGGDAKYEEGKWKAPTFMVKSLKEDGTEVESSYNDVASAFAGVGNSISKIHKEVKNEINQVVADSLVKKETETNRITIGKEVEGSEINIANKDGADRTLSGVKAAEKNNEAVNKGQLDKRLEELSKNIQSEDSAVVLYDKDENGTTNYKSVTFGKGKDSEPVALHNVADGKIAENSHDAINGSQINKISQDLAKFLGGNASFNEGAFTQPTYKLSSVSNDGSVTESSFNDVGSAFSGLDTNIKNVNQRIKEVSEGVAQDSLLWNDEAHAFVARHEKKQEEKGRSVRTQENSKITFLLDGNVSKGSTDAVTGNQLYSMGHALSMYLGGDAKYENGQWSAPSFKVKTVKEDGSGVEEKNYESVASAFEGVGSSFTNIKNELKNEITNVVSDSLVKQDAETKVINIGKEVEGSEINIANKDKEDRTLSGVKAAEKNNEAVNKGQLDKRLEELSKNIQSEDSAVVLYDKDENGTTNYKSVTLGKGENREPVALHNVADGKIAENSHDAINGSQINKISQDLAKFLGGNAVFNNGAFTGPTYKLSKVDTEGKVEQTDFSDVGSAFTGLNDNIKNVNQRIKEVSEGVAQDSLSWSKDDHAFVAKHGENEQKVNSKIKFLQNGDISESSTEAVNGSQLYSLGDKVATYLGGGAKYENGELVSPGFKVVTFNDDGSSEEQNYTDVAAAFAGVSNSFTKLHHEISDNIEQNALLWSEADKAFVALHGTGETKQNSKLIHLVDGDISAGSSEAITGNQLYQLNQTLALYFGGDAGYKDGVWTAPKFQVSQFNLDGSAGNKEVYDNVASAFEGVNGSMSSINNRINTVEQNVSSNSLNWDENEGAYNAGHAGQDSKITHVADGKVASGSKDAVNGGQLFKTNERVSAVENQVSNIDKQVKDIESTVTNGVVKYDQDGEGHKVNKVTLVGVNESDPVLIDNVGNGKIESGSKEAVNGGQLHDYTEQQMKIVLDDAKKYTDNKVDSAINNAADEAKSYTDMKFGTLSYAVQDIRKEARQAAAIGLAVANLSYDDTPGKLSVTFGSGVWRNQSAFALGAGYMSENGRMRSNLSVTSAGGHWGVGAGFRVTLN